MSRRLHFLCSVGLACSAGVLVFAGLLPMTHIGAAIAFGGVTGCLFVHLAFIEDVLRRIADEP